jgi:hypothetical protein
MHFDLRHPFEVRFVLDGNHCAVPIFVAEIRMTGDSRLTQVDAVVCPVGGSGKPLAKPSELTAN